MSDLCKYILFFVFLNFFLFIYISPKKLIPTTCYIDKLAGECQNTYFFGRICIFYVMLTSYSNDLPVPLKNKDWSFYGTNITMEKGYMYQSIPCYYTGNLINPLQLEGPSYNLDLLIFINFLYILYILYIYFSNIFYILYNIFKKIYSTIQAIINTYTKNKNLEKKISKLEIENKKLRNELDYLPGSGKVYLQAKEHFEMLNT